MEGSPKLFAILQSEGHTFHRVTSAWRPADLLQDLQTKALLADMARRLAALTEAQGELSVLPRADRCLKTIRQLQFIVRRAKFVRRSNHLAFIVAISDFYSDFGELLRYLRIESNKGRITRLESNGG